MTGPGQAFDVVAFRLRPPFAGLAALVTVCFLCAGCGGYPDEGFQEITTVAELDSLLAVDYPTEPADTVSLLPERIEVAYGDLPAMLDRGVIRVLVSPSRTNYFIDGSIERGFEYELMRTYEETLDRRHRGPLVMVFLAVPFDRLLPDLVAGRGDIAAAGITVTPRRRDSVAFSEPYLTDVDEIIVGRKGGTRIDSLEDLAGRTVHVVRGSSFEHHLLELNETFRHDGKEPITVSRAPRYLEAEDLLELVDRGVIDFTVADGHIAEFWSSVLPDIRLFQSAPLREGGQIAWAVRSRDHILWRDLNVFARRNRRGSLLGNIMFRRYYDDTKWITEASERDESLKPIISVLKREAKEHHFDWLLLGAIAYQESKFDQSAESHKGAVGLFQIKPTIAASDPIGIDDVSELQDNVRAAVRYLDHLRDVYITDPEIPESARIDLMLASYNAGPTRIRRMRDQAASRGYDPNRWFGNVERMAGRETIRYVANINRHYYALKLAALARQEREANLKGL